MKKILLIGTLFFYTITLNALDACGSPASSSFTLDNSTSTAVGTGSIAGTGSDTYYVNMTLAGTVSVTVTGTNIVFSQSESICPSSSGGATTYTKTFAAAADFNLRVYKTFSGGGPKSYTLTINFTPSSIQPPVANNDTASTNQDVSVDINVTENDTDIDGTIDIASVIITQGPANGNVSINTVNGLVTYIPAAGYLGIDSFKYTVKDNDAIVSNEATVTVTVNEVVSLNCSTQLGEGTMNEIYKVGNTNFFEVKIFDPAATDYSNWDLLYCPDGTEFDSCVKFLDVPNMTQSNIYWFLAENLPGFDSLNSVSKFTLFMVDGNNDLIDMLVLNGSTLGSNTTVDCTFLYDTTAETTSSSKAIARNPDGTGDWADSGGSGSPTDSTPGDNNNGTPTSISSDYKMDECFWDGTVDEVLDSSENGYHGRAVNGPFTDSWGQVQRGAYFDGIDDYIEQADIYDNLKATASLSFWIKTTQASPYANAQRSPGIIGIEDNGGEDDIFWGWIDNNGHINLQKGNNIGPKSSSPINDNSWHHVVFTRDHISQVCKIYVDGVLNDTDTSAPGIVGNAFTRIGSMMDTDGTHTYFKGYLDELKTFSTILTDSEVGTIYTNELAKNNYDGLTRVPIICPQELLAEYRMDECVWDGTTDEVLDSGINGYYAKAKNGALTESVTDSGGGTCLSGKFDGTNQYVEIGQFPDVVDDFTITAWFKTSDRSKAGQRIFADDESSLNGYAISMGDGGVGRVRFYDRSQNNQGIIDTANKVQNDTWYFGTAVNDKRSAVRHLYLYSASGTQLDHQTQAITRNRGLNSGLASIGGETDGGEINNRLIGNVDEVKVFTKALTQADLESILNNEIAGLNWDGSGRTCPACTGTTPKDGNYNAVDLVSGACSATLHWSNTLSTSIINDDINLSILAKDIATDLPLEANITKVTLVHYPDGNNNACTGASLASIDVCTDCGLTDLEGCLRLNVNKNLNQRASKCVEVLIEGRDKDAELTHPVSESNASDNFAVRPDTYNCDGITPSVLVAEHSYPSNFNATPLNLTAPSSFYTTSSVVMSANKYMRTGELNTSLSGAMSPSVVSFVNGSASIALSFNDACDVGIDLNDSAWANVDSDDTPEADRVIHAECRRLFRPDHFSVVLPRPSLENNASTGFTYLSNLSPSVKMSAWMKNLSFTLTAQGENNGTMQNYKDPSDVFYANTVDLFPLITLPTKHSAATKQVDLVDDNNSNMGFVFVDGAATYDYEDVGFNYDRSYNAPIAPFSVEGNESTFSLSVEDRLYPSVTGSDSTDSDNNVSFYYGRLRPIDLITTLLPANGSLHYEVYDNVDSMYTQGMKQTSLFWYINDLHNNNNEGNVSGAIASSDTFIDNTVGGFDFSYYLPSLGQENLGIDAVSQSKATIHLKTQEWLWYVPEGFGLAYDDNAGTDCTSHPCFKFALEPSNSALKIESGDFKGTVVPDVNRDEYIKKGVKLFR